MTHDELIQQCRYYKGEKSNPYDWQKENDANQFWEYEQLFCTKYLHGTFGSIPPKDAIVFFLDNLFKYLGDRYETTDTRFYKAYYRGGVLWCTHQHQEEDPGDAPCIPGKGRE